MTAIINIKFKKMPYLKYGTYKKKTKKKLLRY